MLAWGVSCLAWALLLTRFGVGQATGISALRYGLILVAAVVWLGEPMDWRQGLGCGLIAVGIWLTAK